MKLRGPASAGTHLAIAVGVGVVVGLTVRLTFSWGSGLMSGWVAGAVTFLAITWPTLWRMDASATAELAKREDPGRALRDVVLLGVSAASILAVAFVIIPAGVSDWPMILLGVACVVVSWVVVHTIFMLKYARLFYGEPVGGIDFNQDGPPSYRDFAYLAFTVGMTFQVSDTDLGTTAIRSTVLRQALLSFMYGAMIIAVTINVIAGLSGD